MGRGTWWATVHGVTKSQAQLNNNHRLGFLHICSLGGTALLRLPSDLGWRSGMLGLACLLLGAVVLLYHLQALI